MTRAGGKDGATHHARRPRAERQARPATRRPSERRWVLMGAQERDMTLEQLLSRCARPLSRALHEACGWAARDATWEVGDYNFLVLTTRPRRDDTLFVQWWSEPMEPVAAEVCSPRREPAVARYLAPEGRKVLRRLGYRADGAGHNYRKLVRVDAERAVPDMAREALTVLHAAFGYRGRTPLEAQLVKDARSRLAPVHDALTPEDVARLVMSGGDLAEVKVAGNGQPVVFAAGESPWIVHLPWRTNQSNLYAGLHFYRLLPRPPVLDTGVINRINSGLLFGKIVVDEDGDLAVTMDVRIDGGVTTEWLARVIRQWREVAADVDAHLTAAKESLATMAAAAQIVYAKGLLQE